MKLGVLQLPRRCIALAAPYGWHKLVSVMVVIFTNGVFQVIGVTSIFPFFALAAEPARFRESRFGNWLLGHLPQMNDSSLLVLAGVVSIALLVLSNAVTLAGEVIRTRYGHGLGHFLRTRMMEALSDRPYSYFLERNSGALLQKIVGDVMQFINGIFLPLLEALSRVVTLAFLLLTVFIVQPVIAVGTAVLLGGFYGIVFLLLRRHSHRVGDGIERANRGTMIAAQQFLGGIKPILVHNRTAHFTGEFARHSAAQARLLPWVPIYGNGPRYLVEPVAFGALVAVVIWFAAQGRSFSDILPNLTVITLASYRILPSVQLLYGQLSQIHSMRYIVGEIEAELAEIAMASRTPQSLRAQVTPASIPFETAIRLQNITFSYPSSVYPVLHEFSLEIPKNGSVGIIGTTGSGKTTLVDIVLGLHHPQSGTIRIDDRILTPMDFTAWRAIIGYVPQDIYLLDATVAENIAFGVPRDQIDQAALREAAGAAQILRFIESELPAQWDTVVGERGVRLSGGQRQRIGLARALYHRPQVLILDEATSALDANTEAEVMKAISALRGNLTMIIIAHRLSTLEACDSVCRLENGEPRESNTSADVYSPNRQSRHVTPKRPTFLIIGSAKCGTTALASILGAHPDCCMSDPKEVSFFQDTMDFARNPNYEKGWQWYRKAFAHYNGEPIVGEATPSYSDRGRSPNTAARIFQFNPEMRIIYMVRDPLERQLSAWKMQYAEGRDGTFPWRRESKWALNGFNYWMRRQLEAGQWDECRYDYQLEGYLEYFPRQQILVSFLEDWKLDKDEEVKRIMLFLGLNPELRATEFQEKANRGDDRKIDRPILKQIRKLSGAQLLIRRFAVPWRNWMRTNIAQMKVVPPEFDPSDEISDEFLRFVGQDAQRILERCGKPPDYWKCLSSDRRCYGST